MSKNKKKQRKNLHQRLRTCVLCKRLYRLMKGGSGSFCSQKCKLDYEGTTLPLAIQIVHAPEKPTKSDGSGYPFNCRICDVKVIDKHPTKPKPKAHKQNKCRTHCKGSPKPGPATFFDTREWLELRYKVLKKYGRECMLCKETKGKIHVDHIKPRSKYPELSLVESNLQVLCEACNLGKGAWDQTDWRATTPPAGL